MQEDFLFAGTVHENLVMEREDVTESFLELARSRRAAPTSSSRGCLEVSRLRRRAARPSRPASGSSSRSRALAGDRRIVILDEATASVDSNTEAQIEAATRRLLEGRSALVVAHRLSTVRRANRILVMHRGRLREQGTHAELLAQGGIYARLHALQFSEEEVASAPLARGR
jgi:ATP-binding cassette subfamily B protein